MRQRGVTLPVVFLTSHADVAYEKLAFDRGALDFVDKTRGVEILARRLRLAYASGKPEAQPQPDDRIYAASLLSRRPSIGLTGMMSMSA